MTEQKRQRGDNIPLNGPDPEDEQEQLNQLMGNRDADEQGTGVFAVEHIDGLAKFTDSHEYRGEVEATVSDGETDDLESLDLLTELELREGETDDAYIASAEGLTYVPPMDPPTVPSDSLEGAEIASGFGLSSLDEPYDDDHHGSFESGDDEMVAQVRAALLADSATTQYAAGIAVRVVDGVVTLRGRVADLDDSDNLVAVASYVEGVVEVVDELRVKPPRGG